MWDGMILHTSELWMDINMTSMNVGEPIGEALPVEMK